MPINMDTHLTTLQADEKAVCPLSQLQAGEQGWVHCTTTAAANAPSLSGLGLFEGVPLTVLRQRDPMILRVFGTRLGIAHEVANGILVRKSPL
jgi:Fe2+ transport system protein FeoA